MATPVNDSYSVGTATTIYAGMNPGTAYSLAGTTNVVAGVASGAQITIPPPGTPSWWNGVAVNQWVKITGSAMSNTPPTVNPGPQPASRMDAWCGLAFDSANSTFWSLANGGHEDYQGNEVLKINLWQNNPTWVQVHASDPAGTAVTGNTSGYYSTGRPTSCHTYNSLQYIAARNRVVRFSSPATSRSGNAFPQCASFNSSTNTWDSQSACAAVFPDLPYPYYSQGTVTCKHPTTEDVYYFFDNARVYKWTQSTGAFALETTTMPPNSAFGETATAFDTENNRIFLYGSYHTPTQPCTYDIATKTFTQRTLTGTAISAASFKGFGLTYEPVLKAYLLRTRTTGGTVYKIDANTWAVTTLTTTGGSAIPLTAEANGFPENIWSRWQYVSALRGVVFFVHHSEDAWFLRTN